MRKRIGFALACLSLTMTAASAAAAIPGPQRAVWPELFGARQIAPGLYSDSADTDAMLALKRQTDATVRGFFGEQRATPRVILCSAEPCHRAFGNGPRGLTYASHLVLIAPRGINATILSHELVHAELHRFMGVGDIVD